MVHAALNKPRILSLLSIGIAILAIHWMTLLNEGLFAEDWGLFPALIYKDWPAITDMFSSAGVPLFSLYVWPLSLVVNIFLYKGIIFLAVFFSAFLVYLIGIKSGYLTDRESLLIAVFSQALPIVKVTTIFTYFIYFYPYVLFLLATYLFLGMETARASRHYVARGLSLSLYFLAFTLNSFLVLYGGAFVLVYLVRLKIMERRVRQFRDVGATFEQFCRSRLDFLLLPFLYWVGKKIFTPTKGLYSNYNALEFDLHSMSRAAYHFLVDGLVTPFVDSFAHINPNLLLAATICTALSVGVFLRVSRISNRISSNERVSHRNGGVLIAFGFMLLVCGTIPYILVGKSPAPGVLMRHAILVPLPLSVMMVGAWRVFRSRWPKTANESIATVFVLILLTLFQARWWENYAAWQARAAKDTAVTQYLAENPQWASFSVYWIDDKFMLKGSDSEYGFQDYTARFRMLWGGQTRMAFTPSHTVFLGVDSPRGERPVRSKFPERIAYFCNAWSSAKDIDLGGPQAELEITPGLSTWTNETIAFEFLYLRFLKPEDLRSYLAGLVTVRLRPL